MDVEKSGHFLVIFSLSIIQLSTAFVLTTGYKVTITGGKLWRVVC